MVVAVQPNSSFSDSVERLNVLLTDQDQPWSEQLPRLLEPQGVRAIRVDNVRDALDVVEARPIHVAVVDMAVPLEPTSEPQRASREWVRRHRTPGGLKLLRVIRSMAPTPPTVVIRGRMFDPRIDDRLLAEALKLEAFSVLDQPVRLEQLLGVLRRLMERYYGGRWPEG